MQHPSFSSLSLSRRTTVNDHLALLGCHGLHFYGLPKKKKKKEGILCLFQTKEKESVTVIYSTFKPSQNHSIFLKDLLCKTLSIHRPSVQISKKLHKKGLTVYESFLCVTRFHGDAPDVRPSYRTGMTGWLNLIKSTVLNSHESFTIDSSHTTAHKELSIVAKSFYYCII